MTERLGGGTANGAKPTKAEAKAARSPWELLWRRFLDHRLAVASGFLLIVLAALSMAAPLIEAASGLDAKTVDLFNRFQGPSLGHPLGTDELGRDLFLRLLYGGQVSLFIGIVAALASAFVGLAPFAVPPPSRSATTPPPYSYRLSADRARRRRCRRRYWRAA